MVIGFCKIVQSRLYQSKEKEHWKQEKKKKTTDNKVFACYRLKLISCFGDIYTAPLFFTVIQ